jgi:hypothetical protein
MYMQIEQDTSAKISMLKAATKEHVFRCKQPRNILAILTKRSQVMCVN